MAEAEDFFLTEQQLADRFRERVLPFVFGGRTPRENLVVVLVGAQPAAGKSQAMQAVQHRYADRDVIQLSGDDLRPLHPDYTRLMRENPLLMVDATTQAINPWMQMARDHAMANGYSLVMEGTFRNPDAVIADAQQFAQVGIPVEVVALAVREERSRLDALDRSLPTADAEMGRWVFPERQDEAYRNIPATVAAAEASPAVQRVTVTNRAADLLYTNHRTENGELAAPPVGAQAVNEERTRPFPAAETSQWLARYRDVLTNYAAAGQVNPTTTVALQRVVHDADTVVAMAHPDPASHTRRAHAAGKPLMHALATTSGGADRRPAILLDDQYLAGLGTPEAAAETQRRRHLDPVQRQSEDAIRAHLTAADQRAVPPRSSAQGSEPEADAAASSWRQPGGPTPGPGAWRHSGQERPQQERDRERRRQDEQHEQHREHGQQHER